ncbi:BglG family transcription antiterminator [Anaerorhabdus sp.]|uniref:BglG family transcription antiterminator n=1 Tax=Anaerorhabdus sp. TaxID=1872524 RepID=UPI002FC8D12F
MKISVESLINVLKQNNNWIESAYLSNFFHVSSRTIRNYVNKANTNDLIILSSYKGYKLNANVAYTPEKAPFPDNPSQREKYILRKLLNISNEVSIYSLSDELYVSDSTIENDLKTIKKTLLTCNLTLMRSRDILKIDGSERNKRKLINQIICDENSQSFISFSNIDLLTNQLDTEELFYELDKIFDQYNLYVNDYGLNNIVLHIIVTIDRIKNNQTIQEAPSIEKINSTKDFDVAKHIKNYIEKKYNILISNSELYYLTLTISSNSNTFDYSFIDANNIGNYIEPEYINITNEIIMKLQACYSLEDFDSEFLVKFTIHIRNLFQRIKNQSFTKNPLTDKLKNTYPLVYDMAIFIANELLKYNNQKISEDEIAFIAFHIGSYLENSNLNKNKISCYFVYADYHGMHLKSIDKIKKQFENDLNIIKIVSIKNINFIPLHTDCIISTSEIKIETNIPIIIIQPFITNFDMIALQDLISKIKLEKKQKNMQSIINRFIGEKLFKRNYYADTSSNLIMKLVNECVEFGYCLPGYYNEILDREKLSPTSFSNGVAIPHSLNQSALKSFLSVIINEKPIKWGNYEVKLIVLIGTCKEDRSLFKEIFDDLIAVLYELENIYELSKCEDYNSFIKSISTMITKNSINRY